MPKKRSFPTFAVIVLLIAIFWFLSELGVLVLDILWFPLILGVIAVGWIFNRFNV